MLYFYNRKDIKLNREKFNILLKQANLTKKEFCAILNIAYPTVNNWGSSKDIPYWVESWLENYIKSKSYEDIKDKVLEIEGIK